MTTSSCPARCRVLTERARALIDTDPSLAASTIEEGLSLWRGAPLAGLRDIPIADIAAVAWNEARLDMEDLRAEAQLAAGRDTVLIPDLHEAVAKQPLRARRVGLLMKALYRSGRQSDAVAAFSNYRRALAVETGLDPDPALATLLERILSHDPSLTMRASALVSDPAHQRARPPEPHARPPKPRRALILGLSAAAILVLSVAAVALYGSRQHAAASAITVRSNSLLEFDGRTGGLLADIGVGQHPGAVLANAGYIWTASGDDHTISQVDPADRLATRAYGESEPPTSLTAGPGVVWVGNGFDGTLSRLLVDGHQLTAPFYPDRTITGLVATASDAESLWTAVSDGTVLRLDPNSLRVMSEALDCRAPRERSLLTLGTCGRSAPEDPTYGGPIRTAVGP